jgi:hypothetical protein
MIDTDDSRPDEDGPRDAVGLKDSRDDLYPRRCQRHNALMEPVGLVFGHKDRLLAGYYCTAGDEIQIGGK